MQFLEDKAPLCQRPFKLRSRANFKFSFKFDDSPRLASLLMGPYPSPRLWTRRPKWYLGKKNYLFYTTRSTSPQQLRSPMLTFATKKLSTGANGQKEDAASIFCPRSFDRAVMVLAQWYNLRLKRGIPGFESCLGQAVVACNNYAPRC